MSGVLILGAGGHAKVVADILLLQGSEVIGFLDDNQTLWGTNLFTLPILGGIDTFADFSPDGLVFGIGSNAIRKQMVARLGDVAAKLWQSVVHPRATVAESAVLGYGTVVAAHAVINPSCTIGEHVIINIGATVDHDCVIESFAHIAPGVHLAGNVKIGEGTLVGIGSQAIPSCCVGAWSTVGAGSTVVGNIPSNVIAKGTPARWKEKP